MPTNKANKVKFGLKNVHYAMLTEADGGEVTYGTPVAILGAVNLSMDAQGDTSTFYADDMAYYVTSANDGYSGDLEIAVIPDSFRKDVLQETEDDTDKILVENVNAEPKPFALLFEFAGDQKAVRHVLYNCAATRPSLTGATTTNTKEPSTETITITASPLSSGVIKAKTTPGTTPGISLFGSRAPQPAAEEVKSWRSLSVLTAGKCPFGPPRPSPDSTALSSAGTSCRTCVIYKLP